MLEYKKILVVLLFTLALFTATYRLTESPPFWFDEGWYFQTAANLATIGREGLQLAPERIEHASAFVTVGYPVIYPLAIWIKIFGVGVLEGRSLMVVFIMMLLLAAFLLAKKLFGYWPALGTLAVLATFPPLYGNGKSILGETPGLVYMLLFLLCLEWVLSPTMTRYRRALIMVGGFMAGLTISSKPFFLIMLAPVALSAFWLWKRKIMDLKNIFLGLLFCVMPFMVWLYVQFGEGASLQDTLNFYANPYSLSSITDTIQSNVLRLVTEAGPLYTVALSLIWTVSIAIRVLDRDLHMIPKKPISVAEFISYIFAVLTILAYLRTAGVYRYLYPAQIVVLIFLPYSAMVIRKYLAEKMIFMPGGITRKLISFFPTGIIAVLCFVGLYQISFDSWVAESYSSQKTAFWQEYFKSLDPGKSVLFFTTPEVVPFIQHRNYYQYIMLFDRALGAENKSVARNGLADIVILTSNDHGKYKDDLFQNYKIEQTAYKYSILTKR